MKQEEYIAVFDGEGRKVGIKTRDQAHRDGDWHWLVFVWVAYVDKQGVARLLLQVRARPGDPFAGNIDAPAGGHVIAEEGHRQGAVREFEEEVGVRLAEEDLVYLGNRRLQSDVWACRRAIQHFHLYPRPIRLEETRFNEEVSGFLEIGLEDLTALLEGDVQRITGLARLATAPDEIGELEVLQASLDSYGEAILTVFRLSMQAIRAYVRDGRVDASVWE